MVELSVDDDRKSKDETGAWRWRTGGRMTSESVATLDGWTAGPSHLSPGEQWTMESWGNGGTDGDGRSAERRRGCRLVTGRVVVP
ncbi:hypothetical protein HAX54_041798 [Datura stramonium]|uniref:Uncharacterized protein n=1 Tax=Datura stramonium TaxID=4076 RepID=A0ABS8W0L1_DATST|nr:hypothetical protein [Datura stramonium]